MTDETPTPKPWFASTLLVGDGGQEFVSIGPYELEPPNDCYYEDSIAEVWNGNGNHAVANGKLIAAAPELADLLQRLVNFLNGVDDEGRMGIDTYLKSRQVLLNEAEPLLKRIKG